MVAGAWANADGLFLQFGTQKAIPEQGGDYLAYGATRVAEVFIDLTSLTTSPQIQSLTTFFPSGVNIFVEKVDVDVEIASAGGTSFSVGTGYIAANATIATTATTINTVATGATTGTGSASATTTAYNAYLPTVTSISDTAFVNAMTNATTNAAGDYITMTAGSSFVGGYVGTSSAVTTHPQYITAKASGTYTAGSLRVRIYYRGIGTIQN